MMGTILTIVAGVVGILAVIVKSRYSSKRKAEKERKERDEDIATGDLMGTSKRLSDLIDRMREERGDSDP